MQRRHENPIKRRNPSGDIRWVARWTNRHGERKSAGTFKLKGACRAPAEGCCAQHAIDRAYEQDGRAPRRPDTLGAYFETWPEQHPRSARTNKTNEGRIGAVLDVELEGEKLRDWPYGDLRRRHAVALVDHMLRVQGRAAAGAQNVLRSLSAMTEDAITDEVAGANPFKGVKVRASDPRVVKAPRRIRVWSWEQMHAFARAAAAAKTGKEGIALTVVSLDLWRPVYAEAMVRMLSDCGPRIGELLPLERGDRWLDDGVCGDDGCDVVGPHVHFRKTAYAGVVSAGTKTDHGEASAGRVAPLAGGLVALLRALPPRLDTTLLFPTPSGRLWREDNFRRDVWEPAVEATGMAATRHEFRHSFISEMLARGVDSADLAVMVGHTVATMHGRYTHGLGRSYDAVREAVGA